MPITLDGILTDWTSTDRVDGVAPVAGYEVYGRTSGDSYVYAIKAPAGTSIGANTTLWLNTDQNVGTGFDIFPGGAVEGGAEYNINFDANGVPGLYTGAAGGTPVPGAQVLFGRSSDGSTVELAVAKSAIGSPAGINTLIDVNNETFLPASYSGPAYSVLDVTGLPPRTDFSKKVAIVYSETTAARYFGNADVNINETGYAQLFMAAQNQAAMAGVPFDLLSESDLTSLANLINYDAIVFPSFQFVNSADVAMITNNLTLLAQNYNTSFIAAGNFMTADQNGALLAGDPYANMKTLFDVQPQAGGFAGTTSVEISSAGAGFGGVGGYAANETIHTYSNPAGVGWLAFSDATTGTTPLTVIDNQTVMGTGAGIYAAVVTSSINGDRNVHFSTEALLGDNNQLWQAIEYAVNGTTGPSVGLQMSRQSLIVASRNDMDQSKYADGVDPANNAAGIYDQLLPILQQWKAAYNFVGSYYINVGDNPGANEQTNWSASLPYYQQMIAMGNEIGSHSLTHLEALTPVSNNTNVLTTGTGPGTFDYEFRSSRDIIQANIAAGVPGYQIAGAAVPGAPEYAATAKEIIQYYDYLSGGYASVGAGYPSAFGYLSPAYEDLSKVYLAPNMSFDFTLIEFKGMTPAQALAAWQAEFVELTSKADVPVVVWPWHDYGPTNWPTGSGFTYTADMFTQFIGTAASAGAEFVTLDDLADRISSFEKSSVTSSVSGNVITATVTSTDAGNFALDVDNLGAQVISSVAGWYAYDNDSVFTDRDGGTYAITLGAAVSDVTHITDLGDRNELVSLTGDGTNLSFTLVGEGRVVVDLLNSAGHGVVTGATIVSQVGDILTIDVGSIGTHTVDLTETPVQVPPIISSNGGNATAAISVEENVTAVTTVVATDGNVNQTLTYLIDGGADAALFDLNATSGVLTFKTAAPDFEIPKDNGANNVYDVIVKVVDNGTPVASDTQALAITVTDVIGLNYNGTTAADVVSGTPEDDTLNGNGGNDMLSGLAGNDKINGGAGADTMIGALGDDTYVVDNVGDVVTESPGEGIDSVQSSITYTLGANVENLLLGTGNINGTGNSLDNVITGNSGNNILAGLAGNDTLDGGAGTDTATYGGLDTLDGGAGVDTANFSQFGSAVWVDLAYQGREAWTRDGADLTSGNWREIADLASLENVVGTAHADFLAGDSNANRLEGGAGNDTLTGRGGSDILDGGADTDTAVFTNAAGSYGFQLNGSDILVTGASEGTDTVLDTVELFQFAGQTLTRAQLLAGLTPPTFTDSADTVTLPFLGGTFNALGGDDRLSYTGGSVTIDGGAGTDTVDFSAFGSAVWASLGYPNHQIWTQDRSDLNGGNWSVIGNLSNVESMVGTSFSDFLQGDGAGNVLFYTSGLDTLDGGAGVDTANFSQFGSAVWVDLAYAGREAWTRDTANLTSGSWGEIADLANLENVVGTAHADFLAGDSNANRLEGGAGNDTLTGRGGSDILDGGADTDTAVFTNAAGSYGFQLNGSDILVTGASEGTDTVLDTVELFQFAGQTLTRAQLLAGLTPPTFTDSADTVTLPFLGGTFNALGGDDRLSYTGGSVTIDGGAGTDTVDFSAFGSAVWASLGYPNHQIWTQDRSDLNGGNWSVIGNLSNVESMVGTSFSDFLQGDGGDNVFGYTGGLDTLDGGTGTDTVDFSHFGSAVWVDLAYNAREAWTRDSANLNSGAWREIADLAGIENLVGTGGADDLRGDANANRLEGGAGDDMLTGRGGNDTFVVNPGFGKDTITDFDPSNDVIQFDKSIFQLVSAIAAHTSDSPAGAVITDGHSDSITLPGVTAAQLAAHPSDFHLV